MYKYLSISTCAFGLIMSPLYGNDQSNQATTTKESEKKNILDIAENGLATAEGILEKATETPQSSDDLKILEQVSQSSDLLAQTAIDGVPDSPEKQIEVATAAAIVALAKEQLDANQNIENSSAAENLATAALEQQGELLSQLPAETLPSTTD